MSEKYSGRRDLRELVATVAGPRQWSDTRESWLARAGRAAGLSFRQVKAIWYGEILDPEHRAIRRLTAAAGAKGREEAGELAGKFETIARGLNAVGADQYSADVAALINAARALRGLSGAGNHE